MNVHVANVAAIGGWMSAPPSRSPRGRKALAVDAATPGGRLRELRARMGQEELADILGVTRPTVSKYEANSHPIPDYVLERAAQYFGVTQAFLRYGDTDARMAPVVGFVGAGARVEAMESGSRRFIEVPASWSDAVALEIRGDSCWPIYDEGDFIVIRGPQRLDEAEVLGRMCVVETSDGAGLLKRVRRGSAPGQFTLESPNAPPIENVTLSSARPVKLDFRR